MQRNIKQVCWLLLPLVMGNSHSSDTQLQLYRPFTDTANQPAFHIVETKAGQCLQQSKLIQREDAWRCMANGKTYDPCFVKPTGPQKTAICPLSVWSSQSVAITVNEPLDNKEHTPLDMSLTLPWAIELASGKKCYGVQENASYDNLPVHYRCDASTVLVGHVQRCNSIWRVLEHNAQGITTVDIRKAWF